MNFEFNINQIVPFEITVYDNSLNIINKSDAFDKDENVLLTWDLKKRLAVMIDKIGNASSTAQGLKDVITNYNKFISNDTHRIYLMKDQDGNIGKGSLVGLLKVGRKRLFVYDLQGNQHELMPLCLLDFFIYTTEQRKGHGKHLFDFMLKYEQIHPKHLAIDTPSVKSVRFLNKHYNLKDPIPQNNRFVVYPGFFDDRNDRLNRRNKFDSYSANGNLNMYSQKTLPPLSMPDIRHNRQKNDLHTDPFASKPVQITQPTPLFKNNFDLNDKTLQYKLQNQATMISPTTNNNNNNSNTNNSNPHLTNKLYSAPVLEKSTFQLNSNRTTFDLKTNSNTQINNESPNNTTNTNTQPYIPKSYTTFLYPVQNQTPKPDLMSPKSTATPTMNGSANANHKTFESSFKTNEQEQRTLYNPSFNRTETLNRTDIFNRNNPFPSLNAAKPPIYGQYSSSQPNLNSQKPVNNTNIKDTIDRTNSKDMIERMPVNMQATFNQIDKYSPFPSLNSNHTTNQPNAYYLDKFRKTKLW